MVALDPKTGAILALVTSPSFDPNLLAVHDGTTLNNNDRKLTADPAKPLLDRATELTYPPGSTFKLITAAAALSSGKYTPTPRSRPRTSFSCRRARASSATSGVRPARRPTGDAARGAHHVCNTAFAKLGLTLGGEGARAQARKFGFDPTFGGLPLP